MFLSSVINIIMILVNLLS